MKANAATKATRRTTSQRREAQRRQQEAKFLARPCETCGTAMFHHNWGICPH